MEIQGYPNYLIYNDGRVFSKKMGIFLKGGKCMGYKAVSLRHNGIQKTHTVHRLVALHYIPNPHNLPFVDHINRDKLDNHVNNLRWVSPLKNQQNQGKHKNNKSGHKNIHYRKARDSWCFCYRIMGEPMFRRCFKNKIDCLCYKYICLLRLKKQHRCLK